MRRKNIKNLSVEYFIAAFFTSFVIVNIMVLQFGVFTQLETYINNINFVIFWFALVGILVVLMYVVYLSGRIEIIPFSLLLSSVCFAFLLAIQLNNNIYFCIGLAMVLFIIIKWICLEDKLNLDGINISYKLVFKISLVLFIIISCYIVYTTILRYRLYSSSAFDFGIFAQMFENMYRTGIPNTTVERNKLMSHFGVHFSPSFYLLLPGYFLYPNPEYLLIAQGLFVMFGIFAVYGICRKLNFGAKTTLAFVLIYSFFPSFSYGCFYDFHENKFLTVLILYIVYFYISKKTILALLFGLLTLGIKEDAAIYTSSLALFILLHNDSLYNTDKEGKVFNHKNITGTILLIMSVIYYLIAQWIISHLGEGVMMWRLSDYFISDDKTFASVLKTCFYNIGYLIKQVFIGEKLEYIYWMLLPVSFIPFLSKRVSILILLIPMLVINLMPSWVYQYNVGFQYTYGVAALIIIASIFVCVEFDSYKRRFVLLFAICIGVIFTGTLSIPRGNGYIYNYSISKEKAEAVTKEINNIPMNSKVLANTFLIPHLYKNINNLYVIMNNDDSFFNAEYILLDERYSDENTMFTHENLINNNYEFISKTEFLSVYKVQYR